MVVCEPNIAEITCEPINWTGMYRKVYQTRSLNAKEKAKCMIWTNEMDLYLSKILVDQLKKEDKFENIIKPATYTVAVAALNEKFGLHSTKDHLKNRLKTWRKQYGVLKQILAQDGFKWDKVQKIIVADDGAWNDYLKINPDAKVLQGRVIDNYEELCIIVGNDNPTENSKTDAEDDLDWAAETEGVETEVTCKNRSDNAKERGKCIIWTDEMDRFLAEKLVEQVKLGNKLGKIITSAAYKAVVTALNENFTLDVTKENIKNRLKTLKRLYGLAKELLSHRGFEWNDKLKMILAADSVWEEYIKTHPDAKYFRAKSIEIYNELRVIIDNDDMNGCWSTAGPKGDMDTNNNEEDRVETPLPNMLVDEGMGEDNMDDGMEGSSQQTRARPSSSSRFKQLSKKRRGSDVIMVEMLSAVATSIGRIADALTANNQSVCLDQVFETVQNIPGFDDDLVIEACEFLSFDEKRAKMFLKLDERLRKLWLLKRLRGHSS